MPQPDEIRAFVIHTFEELALLPPEDADVVEGDEEVADEVQMPAFLDEPLDISETILIRGGAYYGRSYRCGALIATLAAETQRLEFYNQQGTLLRAVEMSEIPSLPRVLSDVA